MKPLAAPLPFRVLFPSSAPPDDSQIEKARHCLQSFAHRVSAEWPRTIVSRKDGDPTDYLAGSDETRIQELLDFLYAREPQVGWFGRGGYGLTRLLKQLDQELQARGPVAANKRLFGYSDITALFALLQAREIPVECIHGPMVCAFERQPNQELLLSALEGSPASIPISRPADRLTFEGPIWGGNLAVLASLCGTGFLPELPAHAGIFLEDVDEAPYRVDRYLTQLSDSGFFARTQKVFLGTFTGYQPEQAVLESATRRCRELELEVLGHLPIGHSEPHFPLFLNRVYRFDPRQSCLVAN